MNKKISTMLQQGATLLETALTTHAPMNSRLGLWLFDVGVVLRTTPPDAVDEDMLKALHAVEEALTSYVTYRPLDIDAARALIAQARSLSLAEASLEPSP